MSDIVPKEKPASKKVLAQLVHELEQHPDVAAVYLFGSRAKGCARPGSDYDLAILFSKMPGPTELLELRVRLVDITEHLDLVVLNRASPFVRHAVLATGKRLMLRNADADSNLRYYTMIHYQDALDFTGWRRHVR